MQMLHQMHTLSRNIQQEHPRRKEVLLALGILTSNLIANAAPSPGTILSLLDLANKTRYLDNSCLASVEKQITDKTLK